MLPSVGGEISCCCFKTEWSVRTERAAFDAQSRIYDTARYRLRRKTPELLTSVGKKATDISQGTASTRLRCGGILSDDFVTN